MPHPVLGERGLAAPRQPVAPQVIRLQVRGLDVEHVAVPRARRETGERMCGERRRMVAAVEPDGAFLLLEVHAQVNREHSLRQGIEDLLDSHVRETAHRVVAAVRPALVFSDDGDSIAVVGVAAQAPGVVQRNPRVVAELGPRQPLGLVLVEQRHPVAGKIHLRERGRARDSGGERNAYPDCGAHRLSAGGRGRRGDDGLVPVLLDEAVLDANDVEVIPNVLACGVVRILVLAIPHHQHVRAADERQRRRADPFRFDLARCAARRAAHELLEAVTALRNVRIVLDVTRIHQRIGELEMAVLQHVFHLARGELQVALLIGRQGA